MKEKLTLRNIIVWSAAFLAVLFFCLSFAATSHFIVPDSSGEVKYVFLNSVWKADTFKGYVDGKYEIEMSVTGSPYALPIVGLILVLVAAIGAVLTSFLFKEKKIRIIASIACAVLAIVGGVFTFFVGETAIRTFCVMALGSLDKLDLLKQAYSEAGATWGSGVLPIIMGVVFILSGCAYAVSAFLPEKKSAK